MNKKDLIFKPDEIGFGDPELETKQAITKALAWAKGISLNGANLYPDRKHIKDPPRQIFIPDKNLLRKMIRCTAKCSSFEELRIKFLA